MKRFLLVLPVLLTFCDSSMRQDDFVTENAKGTHRNETKALQDSIAFNKFWNRFRQAVLKYDTLKVKAMVNFPLKVRGNEDMDPLLNIQSKNFSGIWDVFLKRETTYYNGKMETNLEHIKRVNSDEHTGQSAENWQRMGDMQFERLNGQWKLVLIYLDTKQLSGGGRE